jgi:hypothetical protein
LRLFDDIAAIEAGPALSDADMATVSACMTRNRRMSRPPSLIVDLTGHAPDRVSVWLPQLVKALPSPWLIECVHRVDGHWKTARALICELLAITARPQEDTVLIAHDDAWLGATASASETPGLYAWRTACLPPSSASSADEIVASIVAWLNDPARLGAPLLPCA